MKTPFKIKLTPITRKRLKNFMRIRRAKWSLYLLTALFVISLFSELICNSRPLLMRFEGKLYLPFLQNLTMQRLAGAESSASVVEYHSFTQSPRFTDNPSNFALWAPVRHSPGDSLDARSLKPYETVKAHIVPEVFVGRLNLLPEMRMVRRVGCEHFFPGAVDFGRDRLGDHWVIPEEVSASIQERFENRDSPALSLIVRHCTEKELQAVLSMPEFTAARVPPKTVRISLNQTTPPDMPLVVRFRKSGENFVALDKKRWQSVPPAIQGETLSLVKKAFAGEAAEAHLQWKERMTSVKCVLVAIAWPYPPVAGHIMGLDSAGRDVFARVLYATRISMIFGITLSLWAMFLGVIVGAMQGYFGGKVDICGQRLTEIWSAMPFLYIMILVGSVYGRGFMILLLCYSLFNWIGMSYYMRAEFLRLRSNTFVEAARCQGLSTLRIIFVHILPNAMTPIITMLPFTLIGAIGSLAALDFLGFGLPPLTPSWGQLVQQAQQFRWAWWLILFPALALVTVILLTVLIGEGLRDAFDPKQQSRME
ncbi:MAG: ABC transporter permease subunit [Kiritimatiellae bacterium]|nr:ABC transporter permease subunit [Kiritimatiellia bacterium]